MEQDYPARLALDWADRKHAWALRVTGESRIQQGELEHTPVALARAFRDARSPSR